MTFFGPEKLPSPDDPEAAARRPGPPRAITPEEADVHAGSHHHDIGHESPPIMAIPLLLLAGCTVVIGLVCLVSWPFGGGPAEWFAHHLEKTLAFESLGHAEHGFSWLTAIIGTLVGVGGIGLSYVMYAEPSPLPRRLMERLRPLYEGSLHKFYVRRGLPAARGRAASRVRVFQRLPGRVFRGSARDRDRARPACHRAARLATFQNGLLQFYAAVSAMSVAVLLLILVLLSYRQP